MKILLNLFFCIVTLFYISTPDIIAQSNNASVSVNINSKCSTNKDQSIVNVKTISSTTNTIEVNDKNIQVAKKLIQLYMPYTELSVSTQNASTNNLVQKNLPKNEVIKLEVKNLPSNENLK